MEDELLIPDEDKEHARIEQEAFNAVRNAIKWGTEDGVEIQVILYAMKYLQDKPGASIPDAISYGLEEWLK